MVKPSRRVQDGAVGILFSPIIHREPPLVPPDSTQVVIRALVTAAMCERAYAEMAYHELGGQAGGVGVGRIGHACLTDERVAPSLGELERSYLLARIGQMDRQNIDAGTWGCESVLVLLWALGVTERPSYDVPVLPFALLEMVDQERIHRCRTLRPLPEMQAYAENLWTWQWRLCELLENGRSADMVSIATRFKFVCDQLPRAGNDLALVGQPAHEQLGLIEQDAYHLVATERLRAAKWLCGFGPSWWDVEVELPSTGFLDM